MTEKELLTARQSIVQKLTQARLEKGLSQEQLAKRIGTQRSNICRIEKGTQNLSLDLIYKDCNVEEEIVRSLDIERVRAALKALTPEERDIIMNFYFSENPLSGEALAEKFATTKSSIYRRRDHALRKLKSILGNA